MFTPSLKPACGKQGSKLFFKEEKKMKKINVHQLDNSMWKGASPIVFAHAQKLRENMTEAETILWEKLKDNQFLGLKFRRQHPIHKYIGDFYCHKLKLIIEIDGKYHDQSAQIENDIERTKDLQFNDVKLIRFKNEEIENDLDTVLHRLRMIANELLGEK